MLGPGEVIVFTQSTIFDANRYEEAHPEVELVESKVNRFGQEIMRVYRMEQPPAVEGIQDEEEGGSFDLDA